MSERRCYRCSTAKSETEFYRRGNGFVASCKACWLELSRVARERRDKWNAEASAMVERQRARTNQAAISLDGIAPEELFP